MKISKYRKYNLPLIVGLLVMLLSIFSCEKDEYPTPKAATVETTEITSITGSSAVSGGQIITDGGHEISTKGICWDTIPDPTIGVARALDDSVSNIFTNILTGLRGNTTYFVRAFATNNGGISYGENKTFITKAVPLLTTNEVKDITGNSVKGGGQITETFGAQITDRGVCWSTLINPSIEDQKISLGAGDDSFDASITGLLPSTVYHVRSFAITSNGDVAYGDDIQFETLITDYDGNVYESVKIGDQVWMTSNFNSTHCTDGTPIGSVTYHANDTEHEYGAYYSWNDIVKPNFAPAGWHVATDDEFRTLYDYVGTNGLKLKEAGTEHWNTDNGTNDTGFNAYGSSFIYGGTLKDFAAYWVASENTPTDGLRWYILDDGTIGRAANDKTMVFSVRLIKD